MIAGQSILVVDDEQDFAEALASRLERRGFRVDVALSGPAAIERIGQRNYHAVVLDLIMPGMNGLETLKQVLEVDPDLQVILLTAHGTVKAGVDALKSGATDFLQKPADFEELLEMLQKAAEKKMILVEKRTADEIAEILRRRGW